MDASTILSRLQFAFTASFHYLFPQFTMGLALLIVILKTLYLLRKDERYNTAGNFWARIFAITFVMGVVTGIPMEFQFGTNWSRFSVYAGDIIAQTLAMEGAFAFFLESAFLGIFLFGEQVFGQKIHWFSSFMVWLGTWASGAFIIASNAWMQHPVGYTVAANGRLHISDYWAVLFNSWILPQYLHTMSGAVITGSFVMSGLGAYYLLTKKYIDYGRLFVTLGMIVGLLASGFQLFPSGDLEGLQVTAHQPVKLAAMEGLFQTEKGAGIVIIGQPDTATGRLDNPIIIPNGLSFLTYRRWIVYGVLHTAQGSSTTLSVGNVLFTLLGFAGMYLLLGLLYVVLVVYEALRGPEPAVEETTTDEWQPASSTYEQKHYQPAREEHPPKEQLDYKPENQAKKGPSKGVTALEVIAGTILAFAVELIQLRRRK